ncbi:hypothetical protein F4806DRAFT_333210 [Annulohypoxylon nitens]|nr:hypothetical protein F4806DRAFT_333210 [Annulohypoxylon nitens]
MSLTNLTKPNQLHALLQMPVSLRLELVAAPFRSFRSRFGYTNLPSININRHASSKSRKGDSSKIAGFGVLDYGTIVHNRISNLSHEEVVKNATLPSFPHVTFPHGLQLYFSASRPRLWDATMDFYKLRKNTHVPEIAILGRSNVGKSTYLNALVHSFRSTVASTSKKAGRTRTIMTYGVGPPPSTKDLISMASKNQDKDKLPEYSLYVVDMPGYGENSLEHWGDNIKLYLEKRAMLKGVVVLIDSVVGPKSTDEQLFRLLCSLELKTSIVLTKADKAGLWVNRLRLTARKVRDLIHRIQKANVEKNWPVENIMYLTACDAKDAQLLHSTLLSARLVVARQAGILEEAISETDRNKKWSGEVVSFDNLQYKTDDGTPTKFPEAELKSTPPKVQAVPAPVAPTPVAPAPVVPVLNRNASSKTFSFADLELASAIAARVEKKKLRSYGISRRKFHTSIPRPRNGNYDSLYSRERHNLANMSEPIPGKTKDQFFSLVRSMQRTTTRDSYVRNMRNNLDKKELPPVSLQPFYAKNMKKRRQAIWKEDMERAKKVKATRLSLVEEDERRRAEISSSKSPVETGWKRAEQSKKDVIDDDDGDWSKLPPLSPRFKAIQPESQYDIMSSKLFGEIFNENETELDLMREESREKEENKKKKKKDKVKKEAKKEVAREKKQERMKKDSKTKNGGGAKLAKNSEPIDPFAAKFSAAFTPSKKVTGKVSF